MCVPSEIQLNSNLIRLHLALCNFHEIVVFNVDLDFDFPFIIPHIGRIALNHQMRSF